MTSSRARVLFVNGPCRRVHEAAHLVELSRPLLRTAAQLRAELEVRTPDAIQLATAIHGGCSMLVTNDRRLPEIPGLAVRQVAQGWLARALELDPESVRACTYLAELYMARGDDDGALAQAGKDLGPLPQPDPQSAPTPARPRR